MSSLKALMTGMTFVVCLTASCSSAEQAPTYSAAPLENGSFENVGALKQSPEGEAHMALQVVTLVAEGPCLKVDYDGGEYDPVFVLPEDGTATIGRTELKLGPDTFEFGKAYYSPGLITSDAEGPQGCYGRTAYLRSLHD